MPHRASRTMRFSSSVTTAGHASPRARSASARSAVISVLRGGGWLPPMRQKLLDPTRRMRVHAREHVGQIRDRVHAVLLAGRDERVEDREVLAGLLVAEKKIVRAPQGHTAQRSFSDVVVGRDRRVSEEASERAEVAEADSERFAHPPAGLAGSLVAWSPDGAAWPNL